MREGMTFDDSLPFADHDPLIGIDVRDSFYIAYGTVRPADRQIGFYGVPHPEVYAEVPLGDVEPATANFVDFLPSTNRQCRSRTDGVATGGGDGANEQCVPPGPEVL